ncbi:hypothetical protein Tco_0256081 [Tanacetum coccineum]
MGDANPIRTLGDYSNLATQATGTPLSSPKGTMWCLFDPTSSSWCKTDAHSTDFSPRIQTNTLRIFLNYWTHLTLMVKIGKERACENLSQKHGLVSKTYYKKYLIMALTFGSKSKSFMTMSLPLQDEPLTNRPVNDPKDFAKPVKAISLPQDVPSTSDRRLIELENQIKRLMEAHLALMQPTQVNKITFSCKIYNGPHDTQYCMENPKQAFVDYASSRTDRTRSRKPSRQIISMSTNCPIKEELRGKGIKSPSKLLSPKYMSQSSLVEQNRNPSSPKRVHFVNSIIILNKENKAKEEGNVNSSTTEYEDHEMTLESEEEFEEETEEEIKEEEEDSPKHFDTFPTMKELRLHYNWIMSKRLGPKRKPSNPEKIYNFVERVKGLKLFVRKFTYECDFVVLENTTSVIDHDPGSVVFGKPSVEATGLVYEKEEGTIMFEKDKEKIVFKMPHKMKMF